MSTSSTNSLVSLLLQLGEVPMGNKQSHSESDEGAAASRVSAGVSSAAAASVATRGIAVTTGKTAEDDAEDPPVEVPPPMQPISSLPPLSGEAKVSAPPLKPILCAYLRFLFL